MEMFSKSGINGGGRVDYFFILLCFFLMIRRPPRSTQSRSSAASDVYKRQAQDVPFRRRFSEMAAISLGVAGLTFGISYFVRLFFHLDI